MPMIRRFLVAAVLGIAVLIAALWVEHHTDVTLPQPTGTFAVGRTLFDWKDSRSPREVLAWMWYPAERQPGVAFDGYIPAALHWRSGDGNIFTLLTRDAARVHGHSLANAPVSPRQRSYAVAIIGAGGSSEIVNYSTLAEDLASHGYVVVGFDAPYRTGLVVFPDGRVIRRAPENNAELVPVKDLPRFGGRLVAASAADTSFVVDELEELNRSNGSPFAGRLDLTRVGAFGHSFGGATALQFCHDDARCKAGIDIDGRPLGAVVQTGLQKPFMFLMSDHSRETDADARRILADVHSIYDRLPANQRAYVVIRGANHFTFSDDGALRKSELFRLVLRVFGRLGISGREQLMQTTSNVQTFFGKYLE